MFGGLESGRQAAEREWGIRLRWLADFPGHYGAGCGERTLDAVSEADLDSVIGFNVGGIEVDRDPFAAVFDRARDAGLHSVPHAGETHGPHPLPALLDAGLMVTLNSDDPPMFGTDLTNEYRVAYGLGLTPADLGDLARNGARGSFMIQEDKMAVLAEIDEVCRSFDTGNSAASPSENQFPRRR